MPSYTRSVQLPGKSAQELFDKVSAGIDHFLSKTPIGKYDLNTDPQAKTVSFKASMASGTLFCCEGEIRLDGKLSMLAAPFKGKLDEAIDRWLAKTFQVNR